jgi:hypothetical protein
MIFGSFPTLPSPLTSVSFLFSFLLLPVCRGSSLLMGEGGKGWGKSQIIQRCESLAFYKSLNTLWVDSNHATEKSLPSVLNLNLLLKCEHISARNNSYL